MERFSRYLKRLEDGTLWKREEPISWECMVCGYIFVGTEPQPYVLHATIPISTTARSIWIDLSPPVHTCAANVGIFPTFAAHAVSLPTMNPYFPNSDEMASLRRFVADNAAESPERLRLKYHGDGRPWISMAISHLESLRKSGRKFIEWSPAFMPVPLSVEQASSEKVAALHGRIAAAIAPGVVGSSTSHAVSESIVVPLWKLLTPELRARRVG